VGLTAAAGLAVSTVAFLVPALTPEADPPPERLAQPAPTVTDPPASNPPVKGRPPAPGATYRVLLDGEPLPGNEWAVAVGGPGAPRAFAVEVRRKGGAEICRIAFVVRPGTGGAPVSGELAQQQGVVDDVEVFAFAWDLSGPDGTFAPPGRYRLVVQTVEQDRPCDGDGGSPANVEYSLGHLDIGAGS
jgi:hypothetical protein